MISFLHLLRYLLPPKCLACGTAQRHLLCHPCAVTIIPDSPTPEIPPSIRTVHALYTYGGAVRSLLHHSKFNNSKESAFILSAIIAGQLPILPDYDLVIPIPGSASRERRRGFSIPDILFQTLLRQRGYMVSPIMTRIRDTRPLFELSRDQRIRELEDVFRVALQYVPVGGRVLLYDDILTTGATAEASARVLLNAGVGSVDLVVAAGVPHPTPNPSP